MGAGWEREYVGCLCAPGSEIVVNEGRDGGEKAKPYLEGSFSQVLTPRGQLAVHGCMPTADPIHAIRLKNPMHSGHVVGTLRRAIKPIDRSNIFRPLIARAEKVDSVRT